MRFKVICRLKSLRRNLPMENSNLTSLNILLISMMNLTCFQEMVHQKSEYFSAFSLAQENYFKLLELLIALNTKMNIVLKLKTQNYFQLCFTWNFKKCKIVFNFKSTKEIKLLSCTNQDICATTNFILRYILSNVASNSFLRELII